MKLIDLIKNQKATFQYYRDKALWFQTDNGFLFPVPIDEVGTTTIPNSDKAIFFMRYIRKYKDSTDSTDSTDSSDFHKVIENASKEVETWPIWLQPPNKVMANS